MTKFLSNPSTQIVKGQLPGTQGLEGDSEFVIDLFQEMLPISDPSKPESGNCAGNSCGCMFGLRWILEMELECQLPKISRTLKDYQRESQKTWNVSYILFQ